MPGEVPFEFGKFKGSENEKTREIMSSPRAYVRKEFFDLYPTDEELRPNESDRALRKKIIKNFENILVKNLVRDTVGNHELVLEEGSALDLGLTEEELFFLKDRLLLSGKEIVDGVEVEVDFDAELLQIQEEINNLRRDKIDGEYQRIENLAEIIEQITASVSLQPVLVNHEKHKIKANRNNYLQEAIEQTKEEAKRLKDELTGALSMSGFEFFYYEDLDSLNVDQEKNEVLLVVFFDIDFFKKMNDTIGHDAADEILKDIVKQLSGLAEGGSSLRKSDRICRRSGDEFMVSARLPKNEVGKFVEKIKTIINNQVKHPGWKDAVKVTGGYLTIPQGEQPNFEQVREKVDRTAIYQKVVGKGEFKMYSERDIAPDISTEERRTEWAERIVKNEYYREIGPHEVAISRLRSILDDSEVVDEMEEGRLLELKRELAEHEESLRLIETEMKTKIERVAIRLRQEARKLEKPHL
ncbi:MAG: hypothetical protein US42_C0008G0007 [Candidatus Magasanikbacteria bacterium GW2011_GWC2_37_14]|uniref:GGDEF domain-containing protein n=1 Tax=Candidatus Magasanikbacteria bacterium GW2011_GWC2_37_14 TaxID=1619046 RepID=A0A0G0JHA1_9BACT|nr:MAG: hypothetical protein US42_C0008G0007 [Candidatus Magasanikbacteria bacterium GW2011_GWC2_37_14]